MLVLEESRVFPNTSVVVVFVQLRLSVRLTGSCEPDDVFGNSSETGSCSETFVGNSREPYAGNSSETFGVAGSKTYVGNSSETFAHASSKTYVGNSSETYVGNSSETLPCSKTFDWSNGLDSTT